MVDNYTGRKTQTQEVKLPKTHEEVNDNIDIFSHNKVVEVNRLASTCLFTQADIKTHHLFGIIFIQLTNGSLIFTLLLAPARGHILFTLAPTCPTMLTS